VAVFVLALAACGGDGVSPPSSAFDAVVLEAAAAAGLKLELASDDEACARLFTDVLGRRPTAEEISARCRDRSYDEVLDGLLSSEAYRRTQRRRLADRLRYSDAFVDKDSIVDLDRHVDRLYRREVGYRELAELALAHPGFIGRFMVYGQDTIAEAAWKSFLGRPATPPEAKDLEPLWRPWRLRFIDGASEGAPRYVAPRVDPFACEAGVRSCVSSLFGITNLEFPRRGRDQMLAIDALDDLDWEALRTPGRLLTTLPMFWEAAVDEVIARYLGYDLGRALPEAREVLVEALRASDGDLVALERMVLGSIAYRLGRHNKRTLEDLPRWAVGPTKLMIAEVWLHSVAELVGEPIGDCDFRAPSEPPDSPSDAWFATIAGRLGGCPGAYQTGAGTVRERAKDWDIEIAIARDDAAHTFCREREAPALFHPSVDRASRAPKDVEKAVRYLIERAHGDASPGESDEIVAIAREGCSSCDVEAVVRELCTVVVGGLDYVAY
jgi:hypothetical protein